MKSAFLGGCAAIAAGLMLLSPVARAQDSGKCDRACLEGWVDRYFKAVIDDKVVHEAARVGSVVNQHVRDTGTVLADGTYGHRAPFGNICNNIGNRYVGGEDPRGKDNRIDVAGIH